jgi:hypothetical protein
MITGMILYLLFGIAITCSRKTNLMRSEKWYMQLLNVVAYPVIIYIMMVKTARLAVKLVEMMDEEKNRNIEAKYDADKWLQGTNKLDFLKEDMAKFEVELPIDFSGTKKDDGFVIISVPENAYIIRPEDVKHVQLALQIYMIQHPQLMTDPELANRQDTIALKRIIADMDAPQLQCRSFDTEQTEPKCGQDMLDSIEFEKLLNRFKDGWSDARLVDIKNYVRKYMSPWK